MPRGARLRPATAVTAPLPTARGELTSRLFEQLAQSPGRSVDGLPELVAGADEEDLQLALYIMYELHYTGFAGVDAEWDWDPGLLTVRAAAERRFEAELRAGAGRPVIEPAAVGAELWRMAGPAAGPSLSEWVRDHATMDHLRELFKHRSAYQLKEADPHTWGIPHLRGQSKAVLTAIQSDEYGNGTTADMHSALFAVTMECAGLASSPNAYLDEIPGWTLATTNLISLFGLHRRLRGCLVGHLALFEMTSTGPMGRYSQALRRLGLPAEARRFFDVHVTADAHHQHMAVDGMVGGLMRSDPDLAEDVLLGASCLTLVESRFTAEVLSAWGSGRSSLYRTHQAGGVSSPAA